MYDNTTTDGARVILYVDDKPYREYEWTEENENLAKVLSTSMKEQGYDCWWAVVGGEE